MNTSYARKGRVPLQVALCAQQAQQPDLPSLTCLVVEMVRTFESGFARASHLDAQDVETRGNDEGDCLSYRSCLDVLPLALCMPSNARTFSLADTLHAHLHVDKCTVGRRA